MADELFRLVAPFSFLLEYINKREEDEIIINFIIYACGVQEY